MGRLYAGILGHLAMLIVVVRGLRYDAAGETTLIVAALSMFAFALVGYVAGELAAWIVEQSVRARVAAEIEAHQQ